MANGAALINEGMRRHDREFRALPRPAQCMYLQLLSQKDLDCAGVLTLHPELLCKGCDEMTIETLWHDLKTLEEARFIFVDTDTDELLVRSYVRLVSVKSPNAFVSAKRAAKMLGSPKLRHELAAELRRLGRGDADTVADGIDPSNYSPKPDQTPSEPHPDPISIPSERGIPSEPHPKPPVPVPYPVPSLSVVGHLGEDPPPERCPQHKNHTDPPPCGSCRAARKAREAFDAELAQRQIRQRTAFWAEVAECADCDDAGWVDAPAGLARCVRHDWEAINA